MTGVGRFVSVSEAAPPADPGEDRQDADEPRRVVVTRRRAPRYRAFGVTGAVVGVAAGLVLGVVRDMPANSEYTQQAITGYFVAGLGLIGTLLGLAVALLAERRR